MSGKIPIEFRALLTRQQWLNQRHQKRLARRIHDEISQKMTTLALQLSLASVKGEAPPDWEKSCRDWSNVVMELGQTIREITAELQPRVVDDTGLVAAFQWLAQISADSIICRIIPARADISLPHVAANELFSICREIVLDFLVPAGITRLEIELDQQNGFVRVQLRPGAAAPGQESISDRALEGIELPERLLCLDGTADLKQLPDGRSVLTLSVPANPPASADKS